jgi:hypothetical protein
VSAKKCPTEKCLIRGPSREEGTISFLRRTLFNWNISAVFCKDDLWMQRVPLSTKKEQCFIKSFFLRIELSRKESVLWISIAI